MQRSGGFGHGVVVPRFVTILWLCSQLCHETAANQCLWRELLATVECKWGCQPFGCAFCKMWRTAERRFVGHVCLRNPFPPLLFWNSKHPIPKKSLRFLRATVRSAISALNYGCIMTIPSLQLQKKPALCTEVIVSKIWITGYRLSSQLWHVTATNQWAIMNHCWDWAFSNSGLEVGLPAFQLPMFAKREVLPKGDFFDKLV